MEMVPLVAPVRASTPVDVPARPTVSVGLEKVRDVLVAVPCAPPDPNTTPLLASDDAAVTQVAQAIVRAEVWVPPPVIGPVVLRAWLIVFAVMLPEPSDASTPAVLIWTPFAVPCAVNWTG